MAETFAIAGDPSSSSFPSHESHSRNARSHEPRSRQDQEAAAPIELGALLGRSLAILGREQAAAYGALGRALAGLTLRLEVAGEALRLDFAAGRHRLLPDSDDAGDRAAAPPPAGTVELSSDWRTLDGLLDGELDLVRALAADRLRLRGAVADLARCHDGLLCYLAGALRCPSFPTLRAAVRHAAAAPTSKVLP